MNEPSVIPEFGKIEGQVYVSRPGAYGLIFDDKGRIAVLESPSGCFLPGGGAEGDEAPEETLIREVLEECALHVQIVKQLGASAEYRFTAGHEFGIRKECVFFAAMVSEACGAATEPDHTLIWLEPREAEARLSHGSQQWAIRQSFLDGGDPSPLAARRHRRRVPEDRGCPGDASLGLDRGAPAACRRLHLSGVACWLESDVASAMVTSAWIYIVGAEKYPPELGCIVVFRRHRLIDDHLWGLFNLIYVWQTPADARRSA
ncbi:MAG: pyrophosphohydrolase including oxidative damage repair enzyme [Capsulimonas sp.]|nr:pyrophosphohydrolase including oxidative damage repair enzyme [Capsulimonas sp.]